MKYIFRKENLTVSYTADETGYAPLEEKIAEHSKRICTPTKWSRAALCMTLNRKTKPSETSGQVQYVALCGNFEREGYDYTGALRILRVMLSYDYLVDQHPCQRRRLRLRRSFRRGGEAACISSYRDPNVGRTLEVYRGIGDYVRNFEADERQMTKYIIGTISELDVPMNPCCKRPRPPRAHRSTASPKQSSSRREIRSSMRTLDDIHALADLVDAALKQNNICVVGSEAAIQKEKELFKNVEKLIK